MLLRGCVPLPRYGRADSARTAFPCGGLAASVLAKRWPQRARHGWNGLRFFFLFSCVASLLCQRRFCEDGADTRRVAACAFLLAAATGEAAIDNKAGVTEADAGLLCVVSGALKGGARQAQVDTARAFTLMTPSPHTALGPMSRKARSQRSLRCQRARSKKQSRRASAQRTHWRALKGRRHARQHSRRPSRQAQQKRPHCQRTSQAKWTNGHASQALSSPRQRAATRASPRTRTATPAPSPYRNLVAATEPQSGSGTAYGKPVPTECDADPTAEMQAMAWSHVTSAIDQARGGSGILKNSR
ncbi:hypothetical protein ERJ75_001471600 [Trypanosoma vivax]|nr:hypothetical protein ERJ75_001471600 [Trypanosoma vivax]